MLEAVKRRTEMLRYICDKKFVTASELSSEFHISMRTVHRDLDYLSVMAPLYTKQGRYTGGIYIAEDYKSFHVFLTLDERKLISKMILQLENVGICELTKSEVGLFKNILVRCFSLSNEKEKSDNTYE